jgi:hypothetical protein
VRFEGVPVVRVERGAPELPSDLAQDIDAAWQSALRRNPQLFDGTLFSVSTVGRETRGHFIPYRHFVAARERPALRGRLNVRPLAVTGILRCDEGLVLGRRAHAVTQDKGLWELVPSGGLTAARQMPDGTVDFVGQLLEELKEEVGLDRHHIVRLRPVSIVEDTDSRVFDLAIEMEAELSAAAITAAYADLRQHEYDAIEIVPETDVAAFMEKAHIAPLSAFLLRRHVL